MSHNYITQYELSELEKKNCAFFKSEFINTLNISNEALNKSLKHKSAEDWKFSNVLRYNVIRSIGLNMFMNITVYKIKDITLSDREVIYNISYINIRPDKKHKNLFFDENNILNKIPETSTYGHLYINNICPTGSIISRDGEYRQILVYWRMVRHMLNTDTEINKLFSDIVEYFIDKFQDRKFIIFTHYYFPTDELRNKYYFELELMITNRKIEFFGISWFIFYYKYIFGTISDHENDLFQKIMLKYKTHDIKYFNYLIKKYSIGVIRYFYHIVNTNIRSTTDPAMNPYIQT